VYAVLLDAQFGAGNDSIQLLSHRVFTGRHADASHFACFADPLPRSHGCWAWDDSLGERERRVEIRNLPIQANGVSVGATQPGSFKKATQLGGSPCCPGLGYEHKYAMADLMQPHA
jgi:hypothetical protein